MILSGFTSMLDSIHIPAGKDQQFQLSVIPKHAGRTIYSLSVVDGADTIANEPVPVQVEQAEPLKVLILASSPDFENKFLKNWLAQHGYEIAVRMAISKNKFDNEYANTAITGLGRITASLLEKYDVIVADAAELSSISKPELATLQSYILQKNKGLIVRGDRIPSGSSFYTSPFPLASVNTNQQKVNLTLVDSSASLQPLSMESPLFIRTRNGTQPLVSDKQNRVFVNSTLYGSGKIIFSTISNTFSWALSGHQNDYGQFWSKLLNKAAGKKVNEETWGTSPTLPRVNRPVTILFQTNDQILPQAQVEGATVYLKNNHDVPFEWSGTFWPLREGWQAGIQLNGKTWYWYAYSENDWKQVKAADKVQTTEQYIRANLPGVESTKKGITASGSPEDLLFILFLICSGYLWLENKYYNT